MSQLCHGYTVPIKQVLYAISVAHVGSTISVQTQVPPLWVKIDDYMIRAKTEMGLLVHTLTAIIYAIVKNVVSPARISVKNLEPFRSLGCDGSVMPW
jgi:hypothetical protein